MAKTQIIPRLREVTNYDSSEIRGKGKTKKGIG
jgi:hypothetical protein